MLLSLMIFFCLVSSPAPLPAGFFGFNFFHFLIFLKVLVLLLFDNFNFLAAINPYFNKHKLAQK